MNLLPIEVVSLVEDRLMTDSRRVAKFFDKRHDNVLRAFDSLECSPEFNRLNFEAVAYIDARGREQREVLMTKDGFMFLVMSFTGAKAAQIKEAFIGAFNAMAEQLERRDISTLRKLLDYEMRERDSMYRARFGSGLMHKRRREKPSLKAEEDQLRAEAQPALFAIVKGGAK